MSKRSILQSVEYEVARDGAEIGLKVTYTWVHFVQDVIPDGPLAGQMGHRGQESTHETIHPLSPGQARTMRDQLDLVLFELDVMS